MKIATAPVPGVAFRWFATSGRRIGHSHIPVADGLHVERDELRALMRRGWQMRPPGQRSC